MKDLILRYKPLIDKRIDELTPTMQEHNLPWAQEVISSIAQTTKRGKTVRGSLVLGTIDLFSHSMTQDAISTAAALEYLHSALLIHDDLIDHDDMRRGTSSMHKIYQKIGDEKQFSHPEEFGKGMALCIGDIAIFGAFSFLTKLTIDARTHVSLLQCITDEFLLVGFGELHDIALGYQTTLPPSQEVLQMYLHKTARYTFSLPFKIGCILTHQPDSVSTTMETIGEKMGLIYQLTDDQLTLTGKTAETGKKIGNDISENKKTFYHVLLEERASNKDKGILSSIFGKKNLTNEDIQTVTTMLTAYNVYNDILMQIETLKKEADTLISSLPLPREKQQILRSVLTFLQSRNA